MANHHSKCQLWQAPLRSIFISTKYCDNFCDSASNTNNFVIRPSRPQQLKLKKVFLYDGGEPMVNHFTNTRVWEVLGHTLSWPKSFSNYSTKKGNITSLKSRKWKNTHFLRRNATFQLKTPAFFLTLEQRSPRTYWTRPLSF